MRGASSGSSASWRYRRARAYGPIVGPRGRECHPPNDGALPRRSILLPSLQKGKIDVTRTVKGLFEEQALQGVLHLLSEYRTIGGAGQSEFIRGGCWVAPIDEILSEGNPR